MVEGRIQRRDLTSPIPPQARGRDAADGFENPEQRKSYLLARVELGSPYIIDAVFAALRAQAESELHRLLGGPLETNPSLAKLYGDVFERAALEVLANGDAFDCHNLTERKPAGKLALLRCERVTFDSAAHLGAIAAARSAEQLAATLFVPRARNYAGLDAILPGRCPVNFTINLAHDLKLQHATQSEGVVPALQALGLPADAKLNFYWALPRQRYEAACKAFAGVPVKGPEAVVAEYVGRLVHFALSVDFPWPRK